MLNFGSVDDATIEAIDYYDFNLVKNTYFSGDNKLFKDADHLNQEGAEQYSRLFETILDSEPKNRLFLYFYL